MNYGHAMENEFLARKYGITRKSDNFFKKETIAIFYELLAFEKMIEILKEKGFKDIEVITVTVGRAKRVGPYTMMFGENPICIIKVVKRNK